MPFSTDFDIEQNQNLREPQREGWVSIRDAYQEERDRFSSVVLPVGCGKSGLIAVTPYATSNLHALVIAPGTRIRDQLFGDMRSNSANNFYAKCSVLGLGSFPEVAVVESGSVKLDDLVHADIVVANIQQIAGEENRWLDELDDNFFDVILVDEGHHSTAVSWQQVFNRFPAARVINFSATPARADGQLMEGEVVYSFPVVRAIQAGYVKRLSAKMLRPSELTYIDNSSGTERTIELEEVIELGRESAEFRRGIVQSDESLSSIVDCAIGELYRLREESGEQRLKIISSALNIDHCIQIVQKFQERGLRAAYVHSLEGQPANDAVLQRLENHELDVIVQARMLGEGFDHPYLAVAMVGSIFANLSPFVQFVGRVMRVIVQNAPDDIRNRGVVVFHAGANVAQRWDDFRSFSYADQTYFADLLPEADGIEFDPTGLAGFEPGGGRALQPVDVVGEQDVRTTSLDPIGDPDPDVADLINQLDQAGVSPEQAEEWLRRIQPTRQDRRRALRTALNDRVQNEAGGILARLQIPHQGRTLDSRRRVANYQWLVSELNTRINNSVGEASARRQDFTLAQLEEAMANLPEVIEAMEQELRDGN